MKEIKRRSAGVKFESDVLSFLDLLAAEHRRSRSFVINQIIRAYHRALQQPPPQGVSDGEIRGLPRFIIF